MSFNLKVQKHGDGQLAETKPNVVKEGTETQ